MGLFNFKKSNENKQQPAKTLEMLDEDHYWKIVDASVKQSTDMDEQEQVLFSILGNLTPQQLIGFRLRTDKLLHDTYTSDMWCAGYIINGGCSDDGFEYFRCWVISRGKDAYYSAKENPDTLVTELSDEIEFYDFESFWYLANEVFAEITDEELYDFIDDDFNFQESNYPPITFNWQDENPDSMQAICPELFKAKWNY